MVAPGAVGHLRDCRSIENKPTLLCCQPEPHRSLVLAAFHFAGSPFLPAFSFCWVSVWGDLVFKPFKFPLHEALIQFERRGVIVATNVTE